MPPTDQVESQKQHTQRTVLLAIDSRNSVLAELSGPATNGLAYSAYGHPSAQGETLSQLGFNGELREAQTCWYMLGNGYRAYNPRLMRFHSPDSWSPFGRGGLNPYMYCVGDPVNRSDPTGHTSLFGKMLNFAFDVKRFFSGDPGFTASGGGRGFLGVVEAQMTTIAASKVARPRAPDTRVTSVYESLPSSSGQPLAGPGPLIAGITTVGGMSSRTGSSARPISYTAQPLATSIPRRASYSAPPPSYSASTRQAMPLWNADTFARSQQPRTYEVYRMSTPQADFSRSSASRPGSTNNRQIPADLIQEQASAQHAVQRTRHQAQSVELSYVLRDADQLREANRRCRLL